MPAKGIRTGVKLDAMRALKGGRTIRHYVGFDVGKGAHWVCVLDGEGEVLLSRKIEATEEALEALCSQIAALGVSDERVVGIDLTLTGGVAALP